MNMLHDHKDLFPVALLVLWLTPVFFIVVNYRSVVARRDRMADALSRYPKNEGLYSPGEHYLTLFGVSWDQKEIDRDKREPKIKELLSSEFIRMYGSLWRYFASTGLLMIVSFFAIVIVFDGVGIGILPAYKILGFPASDIHVGKLPAVVPSLAGAYVASVVELYLRTRTGDLTPDEIDEVTMRQVLAIPLGRAAFALAGHPFEGLAAFVVPAFPLKDIMRYMRRRTLEKAGAEPSKDLGDGPISKWVDGLSSAEIARLEELGIDTYTDLAYANPIRIMAKTGYSLRIIVQWMDHALLSIYARSYKQAFRDAGIPCALDAVEFWNAHFASEGKSDDSKADTSIAHDYKNFSNYSCSSVQAFSKKVALDGALIREIFQRVAIDPYVKFLETLWYSGYLGDRVKSPDCDGHRETNSGGDANDRRRLLGKTGDSIATGSPPT